MVNTSEQIRPEWTIVTPKYFGLYTIDGKVTHKDKGFCQVC